MIYQSIQFDISDALATITLNRPERLNALTPAMADEIRHALDNCAGARAVLIRGEGRAFCSGADLSALGAESAGDAAFGSLVNSYNPLILSIINHPLPLVSAVQGAAAGIGCALALAADFCVVGQGGYFLQSFVNIGLVPDGGASWLLPRLIGKARAAEMMLLGERVGGEKAADWGMVHQCVADEAVQATALELAQRLARGPTRAIGLAKRNLANGLNDDLATTLQDEAEAQRLAAMTQDAREGIGAFLMKRPAEFKGE